MDNTIFTGIPVSPQTTNQTITPDQERLYCLPDVIDFCKVNNFPADVVGRWIWIRFESKPDQDTREKLKSAGFRWIHKRQQWAHNCGYHSRKGKGNPRWKYGEIPVNAFTRDEIDGLRGESI